MKTQLLSIQVTTMPYNEIIDRLVEMSYKGSSYTCVANVHMLVEAYKDPNFAKIVNSADFVTADGMPLGRGLKLLYGIEQERVAGMNLLPDLLAVTEKKGIPVYFYGGTETMINNTEEYVRRKYPLLNLAGLYSPPFRPLTTQEELEVIDKINGSGAKFVFVALGCPKQEKWMSSMRGRVNACMIGIGGALPVMIGMQKRAPEWMLKAELEWLYRLMQEPKRLFKRYAVTNTIFAWLMVKAWAKQGFRKREPVTNVDLSV